MLARFRQLEDREIERADYIELQRGGHHEHAHRDLVAGGEDERPVGRKEEDPRDEGTDCRKHQSDADATEQAGQQDRRQQGHGPEALADLSEHPAERRSQHEERKAGDNSQRRTVARQFLEERGIFHTSLPPSPDLPSLCRVIDHALKGNPPAEV